MNERLKDPTEAFVEAGEIPGGLDTAKSPLTVSVGKIVLMRVGTEECRLLILKPLRSRSEAMLEDADNRWSVPVIMYCKLNPFSFTMTTG